MKNTKKKGFTLVELLVVIAILAILATVSVVGYTTFIDRANDSNAETELKQIGTLINGALMMDDIYVIGVDEAQDPDEYYCIAKADNGEYVLCKAEKDGEKYKAGDVVDSAMKFAKTEADGVTVLSFDDSEIEPDGVLEFTTDGKIVYTTTAGGEATWDINNNKLVD